MSKTQSTQRPTKPQVDVTEPDQAIEWLRDELGRPDSPLAGIFWRGDNLVHVPVIGADGYQEPKTAGESVGHSQMHQVSTHYLLGHLAYGYRCVRQQVYRGEVVRNRKTGDIQHKTCLYPTESARTVVQAKVAPNARPLNGVTHTPIHRPDGSLITEPGYDDATGLLYLPEDGLDIPAVSKRPTAEETEAAAEMLYEMVQDFPFVTNSDRTNYFGALMTPMLRLIAPPAYKLVAIEAHQPSSGKTLLAKVCRVLHGGVFKSEMPEDEAELRKQVSSILGRTTGGTVVIDNVSGTLKSSVLAGLLTSATWDDRALGTMDYTTAPNDRLWMITGNNLHIAGDLPRRTLRVKIDPKCPDPQNRTHFKIKDLEGWATERRGQLIHAMLTLIQGWVVAGMPLAQATSSDSYARWTEVVRGVLQYNGIAGVFDDDDIKPAGGGEEEDWSVFLRAVHRRFGTGKWTARQLLEEVETGHPESIPVEAMPGDIGDKLVKATSGFGGKAALGQVSKTLGRWLTNRNGRWGGIETRMCARSGEGDFVNGKGSTRLWHIELEERAAAPAPQQRQGEQVGAAQ